MTSFIFWKVLIWWALYSDKVLGLGKISFEKVSDLEQFGISSTLNLQSSTSNLLPSISIILQHPTFSLLSSKSNLQLQFATFTLQPSTLQLESLSSDVSPTSSSFNLHSSFNLQPFIIKVKFSASVCNLHSSTFNLTT